MMDIGKDLQNAYEEGYKQGQEDRPKGEWIPVSEKLPRENQKCLVCHKGAIGIDEFIGRDLPYKWRIYLRDYDAWMPLPEPYKGGETDED